MMEFFLSNKVIKELYEYNQLAKQSFTTYYVTYDGYGFPLKISPKQDLQRTVIYSPNIRELFDELRIGRDNNSALLINFLGVFKGLGRITKIIKWERIENDIFAFVEADKVSTAFYHEASNDFICSVVNERMFRVHIAQIVDDLTEAKNIRLVKKYITEFNGGQESLVPVLPEYNQDISESDTLRIYNKEIVPYVVDGKMMIILKPLIHGISKKSELSITTAPSEGDDVSTFLSYIRIRKNGIEAHHMFEVIDLD